MPMTFDGSGTITGLSAGGLPDGTITQADLAAGAARANFGAGAVLQVVQTVKTDTFSTQSTSYVDITGLSVSITPSSTSNKILVLTNVSIQSQNAHGGGMILLRNGTAVNQADSAGSRRRSSFSGHGYTGDASGEALMQYAVVGTYLDSPASISSVTYKVQVVNNGTETQYINFQRDDTDNNDRVRCVSSITVMEIAG
jgi:hypothetical protein